MIGARSHSRKKQSRTEAYKSYLLIFCLVPVPTETTQIEEDK